MFLYNSIKMYKLLFDSDALIKAAKAGFLESAASAFKIHITNDVYNETVEQGKKRIYEDADKIENLVQNKKIFLIKSAKYAKKPKPKQSFGRGETSVFQAYKKGYLIVTDDLSFVSYLNDVSIRNMSCAHVLIALAKKGRISKEKACYHLEKLSFFIRKEIYELAKKGIKGE